MWKQIAFFRKAQIGKIKINSPTRKYRKFEIIGKWKK